MKTYTSSESVPAAVVTLASGSSQRASQQPILFSTQGGALSDWMIKSVDITLVRDWNAGQFSLLLAISLGEQFDRVPSMPNVAKYRNTSAKKGYPYLAPDDEIRIYMGYLPNANMQITCDMLDQIPFTLPAYTRYDQASQQSQVTAVADGGFGGLTSTTSKPLAPVFWGFIDRIDYMLDDKGVQCFIQGRDRSRILLDTRIINLASFAGDTTAESTNVYNYGGGRREQILLETVNAAVGSIVTGTVGSGAGLAPCWRTVVAGYTFLGYPEPSSTSTTTAATAKGSSSTWGSGGSTSSTTAYPSASGATATTPTAAANTTTTSTSSRNLIPLEGASKWSLAASLTPIYETTANSNAEKEVRFHRWVQRPPITSGVAGTYNVFNKIPMEIIQYLANTEDTLSDFYASHVNGEFVFAPAFLDISGFDDASRNYRTYFFHSTPKGVIPADAQMIKKLRVSTSSLENYNRFAVVAAGAGGSQNSSAADLKVVLDIKPLLSQDRSPSVPCRTVVIPEDNLDQIQSVTANAYMMAMAYARVMARDAAGVSFTIEGDPTFFPGEAVRIYNTGLHDEGMDIPNTDKSKYPDQEAATIGASQAMLNVLETQLPRDSAAGKGASTYSANLYNAVTNPTTATGSKVTALKDCMEANVQGTMTDCQGNALTYKDSAGKEQVLDGPLKVGRTVSSKTCPPAYKIRAIRHILTTAGDGAGFTTSLLGTTEV